MNLWWLSEFIPINCVPLCQQLMLGNKCFGHRWFSKQQRMVSKSGWLAKADGSFLKSKVSIDWYFSDLFQAVQMGIWKANFLVVGDSCWWLLRGLSGPVSCQWLSYPSHVFPSFRDFLLWRLRWSSQRCFLFLTGDVCTKIHHNMYVNIHCMHACLYIYICSTCMYIYVYVYWIYTYTFPYSYVLMFIHW